MSNQSTGAGIILRSILAVLAGAAAWAVVGTLGNLVLRGLVPGYVALEQSMQFTFGMQLGRIVLGLAATVSAGYVCSVVGRMRYAPVYVLVALLLALFLPLHIALWGRFPVWYHLVFLLSLAPSVLLGAWLHRRGRLQAGAGVS